jgi:hypothetical protein
LTTPEIENAEEYIEPSLETARPEKKEKIYSDEIEITENSRTEKIFI